jgi:hypothetical protein
MPIQFARREFLAGMVAITASHAANAAPRFSPASGLKPPESHSPFRVSIINDEISQDFGHACEVASREFGMGWIELRGMWKKNIISLDEKEVAGRAEIQVQRGEEFRRGLHTRPAGRSSGARHGSSQNVSDRSRALLRFLASGGSGSVSRRHQ